MHTRLDFLPTDGSVEWIVATPEEAKHVAFYTFVKELDTPVVLIPWNDSIHVAAHDLLGGFMDYEERKSAIRWAEGWMNARERQLAQTPAVSLSPDLMERLQLAATAVDPGAIARAAKRADEGVARVFGGGDNAEAKPPHLPAGVALTADHESVLAVLGKTPTRCRTVIDISSAGTIRNRETVGRLLGELAGFGMVDRPHGKRKGYALTDAGRKRLRG